MKITNDTELQAAIKKIEKMCNRIDFPENEALFERYGKLAAAIREYEDQKYLME